MFKIVLNQLKKNYVKPKSIIQLHAQLQLSYQMKKEPSVATVLPQILNFLIYYLYTYFLLDFNSILTIKN